MKSKELRVILKFMGWEECPKLMVDWNAIMFVVDKVEKIAGSIKIDGDVSLSWWYSPAKYTHFSGGQNPDNNWKVKREPFSAIGGKFHRVVCYYEAVQFKHKKNEMASTKKEAVLMVCYRFIEWYNRAIPKGKRKEIEKTIEKKYGRPLEFLH